MMTLALAIDDTVVSAGKALSKDEIEKIILKYGRFFINPPGLKGEGEYVQSENLVLLVIINKKTGIPEDSKSF